MNAVQNLQRLEFSVRALAQDSLTQRALFPSFASVGDELAVDFEVALRAVQQDQPRWDPDQATSIAKLDAVLDRYSGPEYEDVWLNVDALESSPIWAEIRVASREVIRAMRWPSHAPPTERFEYFRTKPEPS